MVYEPLKSMMGPAAKELNRVMITSNRFFLFDLLKNAISNIVYGFFNYLWDSLSSILSMKLKDMVPDENVSVTELAMMVLLGLVAFKMLLRVLIFCAPLGKSIF